jgi:NADPH:quinone reductase-like Zn-dependent oxidoreductase
MKAIHLASSKPEVTLELAEVDRPKPSPGQILIEVHAAGVTATELNWYPSTHTPSGQPRLHAVPCHEFSGIVAALGDGATGFEVGQPVFGMNDWFQQGALAEYCLTLPWCIAPKPVCLTHIQAATVPIGALTAWQGLFEKAGLQSGERILIQGAGGGVGLFAVQLARLHGAHVIATTSTDTVELVRGLGANQVVNYRSVRFEEVVGSVDVVFDTVGGDTRERSRAVLSRGGRMVSIAADGEVTTSPEVRNAYFIVEPNRQQLDRVSEMLCGGRLRTFTKAVMPLARAADAFDGRVGANRGAGKIVINVVEKAEDGQ